MVSRCCRDYLPDVVRLRDKLLLRLEVYPVVDVEEPEDVIVELLPDVADIVLEAPVAPVGVCPMRPNPVPSLVDKVPVPEAASPEAASPEDVSVEMLLVAVPAASLTSLDDAVVSVALVDDPLDSPSVALVDTDAVVLPDPVADKLGVFVELALESLALDASVVLEAESTAVEDAEDVGSEEVAPVPCWRLCMPKPCDESTACCWIFTWISSMRCGTGRGFEGICAVL